MLDVSGGILTTILTVATIIACAVTGLTVGTVRTLRDSNNDLRGRVKDLEDNRAADQALIATQKADLDALGRVVTGEVHWKAQSEQLLSLTTQVVQLQQEARQHWTTEQFRWETLTTGISRLVEVQEATLAELRQRPSSN